MTTKRVKIAAEYQTVEEEYKPSRDYIEAMRAIERLRKNLL